MCSGRPKYRFYLKSQDWSIHSLVQQLRGKNAENTTSQAWSCGQCYRHHASCRCHSNETGAWCYDHVGEDNGGTSQASIMPESYGVYVVPALQHDTCTQPPHWPRDTTKGTRASGLRSCGFFFGSRNWFLLVQWQVFAILEIDEVFLYLNKKTSNTAEDMA